MAMVGFSCISISTWSLLTCWLWFQVVQIYFIFVLPWNAINDLPPDIKLPTHLAYIELFQPFTPAPYSGMYKILQSLNTAGECLALVISIDETHWSVHLYPKFRMVHSLFHQSMDRWTHTYYVPLLAKGSWALIIEAFAKLTGISTCALFGLCACLT